MTIINLHDDIYMVVINRRYTAVRAGLRNAIALAWQRAGL
jgi:hypothetical protein